MIYEIVRLLGIKYIYLTAKCQSSRGKMVAIIHNSALPHVNTQMPISRKLSASVCELCVGPMVYQGVSYTGRWCKLGLNIVGLRRGPSYASPQLHVVTRRYLYTLATTALSPAISTLVLLPWSKPLKYIFKIRQYPTTINPGHFTYTIYERYKS